jgi:ribosome biogenesis GTPase
MTTGVVVRIVGNLYHVKTGAGSVECSLTNTVRRGKREASKPAAVGDEVEIELGSAGTGVLVKALPRRTKLCRARGPKGERENVLVANAERLLAVFASRAPEPDWRMLDRALVMGEAGRMFSAVAINKTDLAAPPDMGAWEGAGYRVFRTCALTGAGLDDLREWLAGHSTVLMGPSGVGKSSLLNAIEPEWKRRTGELSERIEEGRHTTTWVEMLELSGGGWVVDTPGIENFGIWGVEAADLASYFPEMGGRACRFRDCRHHTEPGCGIKAGVEAREIGEQRYASYLGMLKELS